MLAELVCRADDRQWLAVRQTGVTATDIPAIIGLSPYESEYSLHLRKRGLIPQEDLSADDRCRLGHVLQPYVLQRWREAADDAPLHSRDTLWRSTARPWQLATVDALTTGNRPVEAKTWADADRWHWEDGPPARVHAQAAWQADTLGAATGEVAVLFLPSGELRRYVLEFEEDEQDALRQAGEAFMRGIRLKAVPSVDGSIATIHALKALYSVPALTTGEVDSEMWGAFIAYRAQVKDYESAARFCEAQLREQIGNARVIMVDGERVGTHVMGKKQDYLKIWEKRS